MVWQTGSGTQTNMNANEVIAGRANEMLAGKRGGKSPVHPNDHVNMGQSSNDSFPTAMHIAAVREIRRKLIPALQAPASGAGREIRRVRRYRQDRPHPSAGCHADHPRPGVLRLCRAGGARHRQRVEACLPRLYPLAQGGTAVGTGLNCKPGFAEEFAAEIGAADRPALRHRAQQVRGHGRP